MLKYESKGFESEPIGIFVQMSLDVCAAKKRSEEMKNIFGGVL